MSLPASIQWDLLPPWSLRVPSAHTAGILEPAYDIAGDAFDYAATDSTLHFTVMDAMGHGISSTLYVCPWSTKTVPLNISSSGMIPSSSAWR